MSHVDKGIIFQPDASWAAAGKKLWTSYPVLMGEEPILRFSKISLNDHAEFSEATTEAEVNILSIPDLIYVESIEDEGTSYDYYTLRSTRMRTTILTTVWTTGCTSGR
jgi:hypothetical protein